MRASEEAANRLRSETADAAGETVAGVERYEVTFAEVEGRQFYIARLRQHDESAEERADSASRW